MENPGYSNTEFVTGEITAIKLGYCSLDYRNPGFQCSGTMYFPGLRYANPGYI